MPRKLWCSTAQQPNKSQVKIPPQARYMSANTGLQALVKILVDMLHLSESFCILLRCICWRLSQNLLAVVTQFHHKRHVLSKAFTISWLGVLIELLRCLTCPVVFFSCGARRMHKRTASPVVRFVIAATVGIGWFLFLHYLRWNTYRSLWKSLQNGTVSGSCLSPTCRYLQLRPTRYYDGKVKIIKTSLALFDALSRSPALSLSLEKEWANLAPRKQTPFAKSLHSPSPSRPIFSLERASSMKFLTFYVI